MLDSESEITSPVPSRGLINFLPLCGKSAVIGLMQGSATCISGAACGGSVKNCFVAPNTIIENKKTLYYGFLKTLLIIFHKRLMSKSPTVICNAELRIIARVLF